MALDFYFLVKNLSSAGRMSQTLGKYRQTLKLLKV